MKKAFLIILLLSNGLTLPQLVFSQSTTEQLEIQKRLNELESKRTTSSATDSAQKKTTEITFIEGSINSVANSVVMVSAPNGNKTIVTNDSTKFYNLDSKGKKLIGFGDLKIGETIMIIGLAPEASKGSAKIILRDQNPKTKFFSLLGKKAEVKDNILTLADFSRKDLPSTKITIASNTIIKKAGKNINLEKLTNEANLVSVGTIDDKGNLLATELLSF